MRKSLVMFGILIGILALALWSLPVLAASLAISDADLADVSGKATNGNVQYGIFDWTDTHNADGSNHKGANDTSGANSAVQQNVVSELNAINWGAYAGINL